MLFVKSPVQYVISVKVQRTRDILPDEQRSVLLFLLFCVPYFQTFVSAASFSVVIHLLLLKTASQQKEEVEGRKV